MQSDPLVSIIMPAYNAERFIAEAVQSVIEQSWKNWELIVVNDGSTDGTRAYLDTIEDQRIQVIHQNNMGVSIARNIALDIVNGEFITFLDADDVFPEESVKVRASYLISNFNIDIVGGCVSIRDSILELERTRKKPKYKGKLLPRLFALDDQVFSGVCYMFRKKCLGKIRFDQTMTHCEDLLFWIMLAVEQDLTYGSVEQCIYIYRVHERSATADATGWGAGYLSLVKRINLMKRVAYRDTVLMRLKIFYMLLAWSIKTGNISMSYKIISVFYKTNKAVD